MMVHIFKVGPLEDGTSLYVPIGGDPESEAPTDLDPVRAGSDVEGLRRVLTQRTTETLVCALELKEVAASLHLPSAEPPAEVEGMRVQIAIDNAQNHELDQVENPRSLLHLMVATREFLESTIATRWPPGHTFVVRLDGDRHDEFAGWITTTPEPTVNLLIGTHTDVRSIAGVPGEQQPWFRHRRTHWNRFVPSTASRSCRSSRRSRRPSRLFPATRTRWSRLECCQRSHGSAR